MIVFASILLIAFGAILVAVGLIPEAFGLPEADDFFENVPPLGILFVPLGMGVLGWGGFLLRSALAWSAHPETPWLAAATWRRNRIPAATEPFLVEYWLIATYVFGVLAWMTSSTRMALATVAVATVPAVLWILDRLRFGSTEITLDPFPGRIGGDVRGHARIKGLPPGEPVTVSLVCNELGWFFGMYARRHSAVLWSETHTVSTEPDGTIRFRFKAPADLPPSQQPAAQYHRWRLRLRAGSPPFGLDHWHTIPVFPAERRRARVLHERFPTPREALEPPPDPEPVSKGDPCIGMGHEAFDTIHSDAQGRFKLARCRAHGSWFMVDVKGGIGVWTRLVMVGTRDNAPPIEKLDEIWGAIHPWNDAELTARGVVTDAALPPPAAWLLHEEKDGRIYRALDLPEAAGPHGCEVLIASLDRGRDGLARDLRFVGGHKVRTAASGAEAVELCRNHSFDFVVLDTSIEDMRVADACRAIHGIPGPSTIFIALVKGEPPAAEAEAYANVLVRALVAKPAAATTLQRVFRPLAKHFDWGR